MVSRTKSYKTGPSLPNNGHAGMLEARGGGGGVLPRILDRGVPRRFVNPNPI